MVSVTRARYTCIDKYEMHNIEYPDSVDLLSFESCYNHLIVTLRQIHLTS